MRDLVEIEVFKCLYHSTAEGKRTVVALLDERAEEG